MKVNSPNVRVAAEPIKFYERNDITKKGARAKKPPMIDREVIAWDMEGMNLSGDNKPQHPVIFGCSVTSVEPLLAKRLTSMDMLSLIVEIGKEHPHAIHVGFGFRYDSNMLLQGLPVGLIKRIYRHNHARFRDPRNEAIEWSIGWIPGKTFTVTRRWGKNRYDKTTVTIQDYSSFFGGKAFLPTAEQILGKDLTKEDRAVIKHGKDSRGSGTWNEIEDVLYYWRCEIRLIRRVFERFRDVMYKAGFALKEWYGPGALANYINTIHKIRPHLGAVQVTTGNMPDEVHAASKVAFSGGRFELFQGGRIQGPISTIDINSAYPYALTLVPSLHPDHGEWHHVTKPKQTRRFGVYRISFEAPNAQLFEPRPMPLFYRDHQGLITYPNQTHGWYWSPEARMIMGMRGVTVHEGWEWHSDETVFPWEFLHEMYGTRQRLGKENLLSMPFKLGPNSLYGKYAQTVGWNEKKKEPPRSHALPIAGWVTSMCRSMLWNVVRQIPDQVIAVETDSVFTTADVTKLNLTIGNGLGEWGATHYDEMLYLQSGMYHTKTEGEWKGIRSRGMSRAEYDANSVGSYLRSLVPGTDWPSFSVTTKPKFIGAGAALAMSAPFKTQHCVWRPQTREIRFGEVGKRRHVQESCPSCARGNTPWDEPHRLMVLTKNDQTMSRARKLPWEDSHTDIVEAIRQAEKADAELVSR